MILTLKGQKYIAALISMGEIVIYVLGLNLVLNYLKQPEALIVYAVGYGLGVLLGAWIEEKIALGYITVKVICNQLDGSVANALRDKGYGVTAWVGSGRDGDRLVMEILAKRKPETALPDNSRSGPQSICYYRGAQTVPWRLLDTFHQK